MKRQFFSTLSFKILFLVCLASSVRAQRVTMLVTFNAKPEQREALKAALIKDKQAAAQEPGNISIVLFQHRDRPNTFYLFERWTSQQALDLHFKKPYTQFVFDLNKTALV